MKITNTTGLPAPIVAACTPYPPTPGRYSVTELVGPPMIGRLRRERWADIEEDAADRLWAIMGSAMHAILAGHAEVNALSEERLAIIVNSETTISGQPDLYTADGILWDYKFTTVYAHGEPIKPEWVGQLNIYAHLLRAHGFSVTGARVACVYRDWSKRHEMQGIPRASVVEVPLMAPEDAAAFMLERLAIHQAATVEPCTPAERWTKPAVFAVMKTGRKSAMRLLPTEAEAEAWMAANGGTHIEARPGEDTRCLGYCPVRQWCPYGATLTPVEAAE